MIDCRRLPPNWCAATVAVIVTPGSLAAALAAKRATETIPIVFETGADPVATGLVAGLRQPGGNDHRRHIAEMPGGPQTAGILREIVPAARSFALLVNPSNPRNAEASRADLQAAARTLGCELHVLNASTEGELDPVSLRRSASCRRPGWSSPTRLFRDAQRSARRAVAPLRSSCRASVARISPTAGGLMSYGGSVAESHGQAGIYAGRILKGEKPGELPVVQVTKVEMVVNMKAAKALGITVPLAMLGRADEVIE